MLMVSTVGPLTKEVAAIIRGRMARFNVNQTELAESVGISQSQLSKMVRGTRPIDIDQLESICDALGMGIEDAIEEATTLLRNLDEPLSNARAIFVSDETRLAKVLRRKT